AAHRLVQVHGVQAWRVEAGEPHVTHEHHVQRVGGVAEAVGQRLAPRFVADVGLPIGRIRGRAGHHHLDGALSWSSLAQAGRSFTISRYNSTQIRRLMQTIIALPSIASNRFSKCSTMSCATIPSRLSEPTT